MRIFPWIVLPVLAVCVLSGCVTAGGPSTQDYATSTHRIVQRLNTNVSASLDQLNASTADLTARLQAYDEQVRQLRLIIEDNQTRLNQVQTRLDELSTTLYRQLNLAPGAPSRSSTAPPQTGVDVERGEIKVVPPAASGR